MFKEVTMNTTRRHVCINPEDVVQSELINDHLPCLFNIHVMFIFELATSCLLRCKNSLLE